MNKKLIALAVAGATFAPAVLAQSANPVTLYGRAWVMMNNIKADGGASPLAARNTVVNESSMFGIRGTEDVGGGLKAFFQFEVGFAPEENATATSTLNNLPASVPAGGAPLNINNTPVTGRNSAVGIQGDFGSILLGRWDTPFKLSQIMVDPYGQNTIGNQLAVLGAANTFNRREVNTLQYWTPTVSGFAGRFMYGANEAKTPTANPSTLSYSVAYADGPIAVNYAYERHKDQRGSTVTGGVTEIGNNLAGTITFGAFKLGLDTQRIKSPDRTNKRASFAGLTYTVAQNEFMVNYGRAHDGAAVTAVQPRSKLVGVGYNYNFSKRTTFMLRWASLKNNSASAANFENASSGLPSFAVDNDPRGFGGGFRHTF